MRRLFFGSLVAAGLLLGGCAGALAPRVRDMGAAPAATEAVAAGRPFVNARAIIIVRHADIDVTKKAALGNAVPLLAAGEERAKGLIPMLKDAGVTRIVVSPALRTQETAEPLAAALKLKPEEGPAEAQEMVTMLAQTAKPGEVILLVHHHSVIPSILAGFGFEREPEAVDATEFDRVYVILPDAGTRTYVLLRARYGGVW